ncbi:MAG: MBL fold metallo-hydrolase [Clostridia bacterium]
MARLYPLFSGSRGNSYFFGSKNAGVLIDAGKNCKQILIRLQQCEIDPSAIKGILVSHEHTDHVSALRVLASKYKIPCFCSKGTGRQLIINQVANGTFPMHILEQNLQIADLDIEHFHTSHDSEESIGFRIKTADDKVLSFVTDFGKVTDTVMEYTQNSDFCVVESNHDISMLQAGPYPYSLKRRILADTGHLSNVACADFLIKLHKTGVKKFMLAHLSSDNNNPDLAYQTSNCALSMQGLTENVDYNISVAPKENNDAKVVIF